MSINEPERIPTIGWEELPIDPLPRLVLAAYGDQPELTPVVTEDGRLIQTVGKYRITDEEIRCVIHSVLPGNGPLGFITGREGQFLDRGAMRFHLVGALSGLKLLERDSLVDELFVTASFTSKYGDPAAFIKASEDTKADLAKVAELQSASILARSLDLPLPRSSERTGDIQFRCQCNLTILARAAVAALSSPPPHPHSL